MASRYYREAPKELDLDANIAAVSQISCVIHASASEAAELFYEELRRKTYMTPTSYLELIKLFTDLRLNVKKGKEARLKPCTIIIKLCNNTIYRSADDR